MKRYFFTLLLSGFIITTGFAQQKAKYVVMISIDAFRPEFYKDASWPAPNIQRLKREGLYADKVRPVFPSVTFPNHATMVTGALPARHGVYYNSPFEPEGYTGRWNWEYSLFKVPTLFDAVHKAGLRTAAVDWPVTMGAPSIDYNFPNGWSIDSNVDNVQWIKKYITPKGFFDELEKNATGTIHPEDINGEMMQSDDNIGRIASYIITTYKPTFIAIHFAGTDGAQHEFGREDPAVRAAVGTVDHAIGNILEHIEQAGIKDSTAVLIVGDHGFVDIHSTLYPNIWLQQKGLLGKGKDWKVKFHSGSGAAFLYLQDKNDTATLAAVKKMLDELPPSEKRLFRIIDKPMLDKIGADSSVALALSPIMGIAIGGAIPKNGEVLQHAVQKGTHGYYPDFPEIMTGFIAAGAGIQKGAVIPEMGQQDIAPIVAKLLGLSFNAPDGILLPGILVKQ